MVIVSSCLVLWGAAWLPGATFIEMAGWIGLAASGLYGIVRRQLRWIVRCMHGLPPIGKPASERYTRRQLLLLAMAVTSPFFWWPLRVSLFIQRPLLDRFAWHAYAEMPMLAPPRTPRMVGLFVVTGVRAHPGGVELRLLGTTGALQYSSDGEGQRYWPFYATPWFMWWAAPPAIGAWGVDSLRYRLYFG
jgi:hypothetical protein